MTAGSKSGRTLFVRNLPYGTTDKELEELFSHYGQMKSCFTVKERGVLDRCKGFGYVTYSLREDAENAKDAVKVVGGRPVLLTFADRKPSKKTRRQRELEKKKGNKGGSYTSLQKEAEESDSSDSEDYEKLTSQDNVKKSQEKQRKKKKRERAEPSYEIGRVVVITGFSEHTTKQQIRDHCSPHGDIKRLEYPVPGRVVRTAFVTYELHKQARIAVGKIDKSSLGGEGLHAVLLSKEGKTPSKKSLHKARLIVRNLSFKCSEEDVLKAFSPFGEVIEVHIPKKPDGRMLGYAFVQFKSFFEASKAIAAVNENEIKGRPVAVDWVVPREKYKALSSQNAKGSSSKKLSPETDEDREEGEDVGSNSDIEDDNDTDSASSDGGDCDSSDSGEGDEEDETDSDTSDHSSEENQKRKTLKEDATDGKTLFVRNVPCDVDEDELKEVFLKFGAVRYCRAVLDPVSGACRGSAFVQFRNAFSVQPCLEAGMSDKKGLWFDGNRLDVTLALTQKELRRLGENRTKKAAEKERDKRNLYLAREGMIVPNSEAASDLTKTELAKRAASFSAKRAKLRNPYFFVSKTRLSVRELPVTVDEKQMRKIFLEGARKGAKIKQVKLMRSKERFTGDGLGRSMGYGFVEFADHSSALAALRAVNNNPDIFGPRKRPIVEFALEDSRVLKRRDQKKQKQSLLSGKAVSLADSLMEQEHSTIDSPSKEDRGKRMSKKVGWQLKWKERRLRRKDHNKSAEKNAAGKPKQKNRKVARNLREVAARNPADKARHRTELRHTRQVKRKRDFGQRNAKKSEPLEFERKPRKRCKMAAEEMKKEREFAAMVKNYKAKLFGRNEDTRWFD